MFCQTEITRVKPKKVLLSLPYALLAVSANWFQLLLEQLKWVMMLCWPSSWILLSLPSGLASVTLARLRYATVHDCRQGIFKWSNRKKSKKKYEKEKRKGQNITRMSKWNKTNFLGNIGVVSLRWVRKKSNSFWHLDPQEKMVKTLVHCSKTCFILFFHQYPTVL